MPGIELTGSDGSANFRLRLTEGTAGNGFTMDADESKPDTLNVDARKALERFIVENDDLLALESRIGMFNIFDALGIARAEIRHSNFLAFILDPAESHGQGPLFLKAILMDLLKQAPSDLRPLSPIDLDGADLRGIDVRREWKNIDLLITCKEPRFAIVVENKVGSGEHSNQLSRYQQTMKDHYPDLPALYVYLTPDGDEPSEDVWLPYTYADIHRVLTCVRQTHENAIGGEVRVFLDHYLDLLRTRFMNDQELDELCQRIYKNHRQALDLIWDRVGGPQSGLLVEVTNILEQDARWHVLDRSNRYINSVPNAWLEWLLPSGHENDRPFCMCIRLKDTYIGHLARIGPMKDSSQRKAILVKLRQECPACGLKPGRAKRVEGRWDRISANERILEWSEDEEPEPEAIRAAVKKALDELYPKLEKLAKVLKPLCKPPASTK